MNYREASYEVEFLGDEMKEKEGEALKSNRKFNVGHGERRSKPMLTMAEWLDL